MNHRASSLLYQVRRILRVLRLLRVVGRKKEMENKMEEILYPLHDVRPFQVSWFLQGFHIQYVQFKMLFHFQLCRSASNSKAQSQKSKHPLQVSGNSDNFCEIAKITGTNPLE